LTVKNEFLCAIIVGGGGADCCANAKLNCALQNKCSAILLRDRLSRKERNGWGEFLSVEFSKYDPEF